jgi:hypothetical protein
MSRVYRGKEAIMANAVLFIGWNRPYTGRESEAWKFVMGEGSETLATFQKQGFFERTERIGLTPHGGDVNFFYLLFGERAKLDELRRTDEFERFSMRLGSYVEGYAVVPGVNAEGMTKVMKRNEDLLK